MSTPKFPKGSMTADELAEFKARMLAEDPEYRAKVEAAEALRRQNAQTLRSAERPIVSDLNRVGLDATSVWELVNSTDAYDQALPVLIAHLQRGGYPDRVMESMGRALAVGPSVAMWDQLKSLYLRAKGPGEAEGLALALAAAATEAQLDDLVRLVRDESLGQSRIHLLRALLRVGGATGRATVDTLRDDPLLGKEARALMRQKRWK